MYKVFFNDRIVFINTTAKSELFKEAQIIAVSPDTNMAEIWQDFSSEESNRNIVLVGNSVDEVRQQFFNVFKIVQAAGGVVFNTDQKLLCIYRWGKWDLPKGKIEKGESSSSAAVREVEEETGISGLEIVNKRTITYHIYKSPYHKNNPWILKPTHWYEMRYSGTEQLVPQVNEDITEAIWLSKEEAINAKGNTYASLCELFDF